MVSVLVLGATGFIGRNLVQYLVENNLAEKIRAVDKVLPQTANLYPAHKAAFESPIVTFKQANLAKLDSTRARGFALDEGNTYDYVFNCAGETKLSQNKAVYQEKITDLSVNAATVAAECGAKFVEISSSRIYDGEKKISTEDDKCKPWTEIAKHKHMAEQAFAGIDGLKYLILRPALVYGHGDYSSFMPRFVIGAIYKHTKEKMQFLWSEKLRLNSVHVNDVVRAMWHLRDHADETNGDIFNLCDKSDTSQGTIGNAISEMFDVKVDYVGNMKSTIATKIGMKSLTEDVNDMHLQPWSEMTIGAGVLNTPLTPYLDQELLFNNNIYMDGSKVEKSGFTYEHPTFDKATIKAVLEAYVEMNLFPKALLE